MRVLCFDSGYFYTTNFPWLYIVSVDAANFPSATWYQVSIFSEFWDTRETFTKYQPMKFYVARIYIDPSITF